MVLLAGERVGHLFSGLEGGIMPSKMSVSDGDGEGVATGIGDSAAIVAYQATTQDEKFFCFRCVKDVTLLFFQNRRVPKTSFDPPSANN